MFLEQRQVKCLKNRTQLTVRDCSRKKPISVYPFSKQADVFRYPASTLHGQNTQWQSLFCWRNIPLFSVCKKCQVQKSLSPLFGTVFMTLLFLRLTRSYLLQPPILVLNVIVIEAEGLEAKDANGEYILA